MKKSSYPLRGFSAIEIIVAVALAALIAVVIAPMFTAVNRAWDKDKRLKEQVQVARDAMDFMTNELKKSNGIIDGTLVSCYSNGFTMRDLSTAIHNRVTENVIPCLTRNPEHGFPLSRE